MEGCGIVVKWFLCIFNLFLYKLFKTIQYHTIQYNTQMFYIPPFHQDHSGVCDDTKAHGNDDTNLQIKIINNQTIIVGKGVSCTFYYDS